MRRLRPCATPGATAGFSRWLSAHFLGAVAALVFAGCASYTQPPPIPVTGDPIVDGNAELKAAAPRDRVLWEYRIAAAAMRRGQFDEARAKLDDAILQIGGILANDADARRARSLFAGEDRKKFIGEPYERVMAYYYRGILYWRAGEPDNARACFRTGQIIDSDTENKTYAGDYVLLDYLDGLAMTKLNQDGSDALARAQKDRGEQHRPALPPYDKEANVLVFAEWGAGPTKYAGGEYAEELRFYTQASGISHATLTLDDGETVKLPAYDDLNFQATTRGGRVMDHILGNKVVFKQTTDAIGNVGLVGAEVAAANMYRPNGRKNYDAENAAIALGAIGLIGKIASAATVTKADIRSWDNLPQALSFAALHLSPGDHPATLRFYNRQGAVIEKLTQQPVLHVEENGRDTVIFLSALPR